VLLGEIEYTSFLAACLDKRNYYEQSQLYQAFRRFQVVYVYTYVLCVCVCVCIIVDKRNYYEQSALYQAFRCIQVCMCIYTYVLCVCVCVYVSLTRSHVQLHALATH